jgi:hypothetical protein
MKNKDITLKVANMRKPQEFTVYPNGTSEKYIMLQSDKRCAMLDKETNKFIITTKNYNYPMFAMLQHDRVLVELSSEQIEEIKRSYNALSNGSNGIVRIV